MSRTFRVLVVTHCFALSAFCMQGCTLTTIKCVDGAEITVFTDEGNAIDVYSRDLKATLEGTLKLKQADLDLTAKSSAESTVKLIYQNLDSANLEYRTTLQKLYRGYVTALSATSSPEERRELGKKYLDTIEKFGTEVMKLRAALAEARSNQSGNAWAPALESSKELGRLLQSAPKT